MDRFSENNDGPLCMFGPGGEYVTKWQSKKSEVELQKGALARVLGVIAEMVADILCFDNWSEMAIEEKSGDAERSDYTPTISIVRVDSELRGEPMLFGDDWRAGGRVRHKPKHRVRTHRRTSKKAAGLGVEGQGSLFELDSTRARTA